MMRRFLVPMVLLVLTACTQVSSVDDVPLAVADHLSYKQSTMVIPNPERGFYVHPGNCSKTATYKANGEIASKGRTTPFSLSELQSYNTTAPESKKMTLVLCIFYLPKVLNIDNVGGPLDFFELQANAVRNAGFKMILRFAYTELSDDAPYSMVESHITQMADELNKHRDVIAVMESGFVGAFGEGARDQSQNFSDPTVPGGITDTNWRDRKAIVDKLMGILPSRMISVRTIRMKRNMYFNPKFVENVGVTETMRVTPIPVSSSDAYGTKPIAQVGYYNDCFLRGVHDSETYRRPPRLDTDSQGNVIYNRYNHDAVPGDYPELTKDYLLQDRNYLAADTRYVAMGGETCNTEDGEQWKAPNALSEMQRFHFTYLNGVRLEEILAQWDLDHDADPMTPTHMTTVKQNLGYRFSLIAREDSSESCCTFVKNGSWFSPRVTIYNNGWAAPINSRPVYVVIRHADKAINKVYRMRLQDSPPGTLPIRYTDARRWQSRTSYKLTGSVRIPSGIPTGYYSVFLWFPDSELSLQNNPRYAIQLANKADGAPLPDRTLWDYDPVTGKETGYNYIERQIRVY